MNLLVRVSGLSDRAAKGPSLQLSSLQTMHRSYRSRLSNGSICYLMRRSRIDSPVDWGHLSAKGRCLMLANRQAVRERLEGRIQQRVRQRGPLRPTPKLNSSPRCGAKLPFASWNTCVRFGSDFPVPTALCRTETGHHAQHYRKHRRVHECGEDGGAQSNRTPAHFAVRQRRGAFRQFREPLPLDQLFKLMSSFLFGPDLTSAPYFQKAARRRPSQDWRTARGRCRMPHTRCRSPRP